MYEEVHKLPPRNISWLNYFQGGRLSYFFPSKFAQNLTKFLYIFHSSHAIFTFVSFTLPEWIPPISFMGLVTAGGLKFLSLEVPFQLSVHFATA
jgi:hypothetical protein